MDHCDNLEVSTNRQLLKETMQLMKNIGSFSNDQAIVVRENDCLNRFKLRIKPNDGLYEGGTFEFEVILADDYPLTSPTANCLTPIYHPNMNPDQSYMGSNSNICLSLIDEWFEGELRPTLEDLVQGILFLFYQPNLEDTLSTIIEDGADYKKFAENVRKSLRGGDVDGVWFTRNLPEDPSQTENKLSEPLENVSNNSTEEPDILMTVVATRLQRCAHH
ncbi:uncharacterized protein LOC141900477 [Tubulanus polymorphus]|uniref:uncharacterized protein LOC141900477 n=1 Tax=Tubulanus polymorphus TaxID=672921 RepID=UPI003DA374A5